MRLPRADSHQRPGVNGGRVVLWRYFTSGLNKSRRPMSEGSRVLGQGTLGRASTYAAASVIDWLPGHGPIGPGPKHPASREPFDVRVRRSLVAPIGSGP